MKPATNPKLTGGEAFCKTPKCKGVLFDISSRLATGLGIITLQCREYGRGPACGGKWSVKTQKADLAV